MCAGNMSNAVFSSMMSDESTALLGATHTETLSREIVPMVTH